MDLQVTPSQRQYAEAHKKRLEALWPAQVPKPKMKRNALPPPPAPRKPTADEWFAMAWEVLSGPQGRGSIREIQDLVCEHFGVPFLYMETTRRATEYYLPRAAAVYLCRQFTTQSNPVIARAFKRDASTIWCRIKSVESLIALGHPITKDIEILSAKLEGANQ